MSEPSASDGAKPALVAIVDDDEAIGDALSMLLEAEGHEAVAFTSPDVFLGQVKANPPDCVLLDVRMPERNGIDVLKDLSAGFSNLPVIMITGHGDVPMAVKAMSLGAIDFIQKPFNDDALLAAVTTGLAQRHAQAEKSQEIDRAKELVARLTDRERQVLSQIVAGHPNKVIAYNLDISPRTIEVHRKRVMDKTEARATSHLVRIGLLAGVEPAS